MLKPRGAGTAQPAPLLTTEGVYMFPMPENAAVDRLRMKIGERIVEGEVPAGRLTPCAPEVMNATQ